MMTIEERICEIEDYAELAEIIDLCEVKISNLLHEEAWHRMRSELAAHQEFVALAERRKTFAQTAGWWWQENYGYQPDMPRNAYILSCGYRYPNVKGWWMSRRELEDSLEGWCQECCEADEHCTCDPKKFNSE